MTRRFSFLMIAAGIMAASLPSPTIRAQAAPQRIEITAKRFAFTPGEITVKKGQPIVLVLKSLDVGHGLRIRDLGVDLKVKAGESAQVTITPHKTGDFVGHCSVFCGSGHGSMVFTLHVVA
ncbi:MAG: cupredoxin domain-containing protein [Terracidiphilus sp.]